MCVALAVITRVLPGSLRMPMASGMRRTVLAPLVMLQERSELSRRALILSAPITQARDSVTMRALTVASLEAENDRLRQLIGLGARLKWGFAPAEALHGKGVRDVTTLTLTAGSNAGVGRMSPVVSAEGLVGVVESVDPTMSQALFWTHPDFRVSAMTEDASAFGIVQAHAPSATSAYMMELRGVPFRTNLAAGALVISSGLGGVWPRGIPIGRIVQEIKTSEAWARTYLVRPAVFPADVTTVMILRLDRGAKGLDNVWTSAAAITAATNRIIGAGDSLARTAALAEAAARRASVTADSVRAANGGVTPTPPTGGLIQVPRPRPRPRPVDSTATQSDTPRVLQVPPTGSDSLTTRPGAVR
ncbi:MAG: rod shape-determining protein MreC [Gemmatimonadaceae bacterium]|nr:rod shape-determining protein MreC [Gemmatimonadaceae bacterium]